MTSQYGGEDPAGQLRSLASEVHGLRSTADELREDLENLQRGHVNDLREELSTLDDRVDGVENELSSDIADVSRAMQRLASRVEWLERHVRRSPETETVDFDDSSPETRKLVRAATLGLDAEAELLDTVQRSVQTFAINRYRLAVQERDKQVQAVLGVAGILAATPPQQEQHGRAAAAFKEAAPKARQAMGTLPELAAAAGRAQAALAEDDERRVEHQRVIDSGRKAAKRLRWMMRSRLAEALNRQAMLPNWFVTVLGPLPPAHDTDAWMEAGADVLVYRATYQVGDPIVALGSPPSDRLSRRGMRYDSLIEALRRWNR